MQLISINTGRVRDHLMDGKLVRSGIVKQPVQGPVMMGHDGLEGDEIANTKHHGGPDQAVYAYAAEHYDTWANELGRDDLSFGQFGENLTISGFFEENICIGDTFHIGKTVVRATGPRIPCSKLDWCVGDKTTSKKMTDSRRFGIYLRVIEPGIINAGDEVELIDKGASNLGLIELAELFLFRPKDVEAMRAALQVKELGERVRAKFEERIAAAG